MGGGGGRGLGITGSFQVNGGTINFNVGSGGIGGDGTSFPHTDGTTGGTSSITYQLNIIIATGGNPGKSTNIPNGRDGENDGGGSASSQIADGFMSGIGGIAGQGSPGQNGSPPQFTLTGPGGNGGNGISSNLAPTFTGVTGLGGLGSNPVIFITQGGGGGGAGGAGTVKLAGDGNPSLDNPLIGYGGYGYGAGGGGGGGFGNNNQGVSGGNGASGIVVIVFS